MPIFVGIPGRLRRILYPPFPLESAFSLAFPADRDARAGCGVWGDFSGALDSLGPPGARAWWWVGARVARLAGEEVDIATNSTLCAPFPLSRLSGKQWFLATASPIGRSVSCATPAGGA